MARKSTRQFPRFSNQQIVDAVISAMTENTEWKTRYAKYAENISKFADKYAEISKSITIDPPLFLYSSISKIDNTDTYCFDVRYAGNSIGTITSDQNGTITEVEVKGNYARKYLGYDGPDSLDWDSALQKYFSLFPKEMPQNSSKTHGQECRIENWMLSEFSKDSRKQNKLVCNIQPVKIAEQLLFQLTTALSASHHEILPYYTKSRSKRGGGIDILARATHSNNRFGNYLAVLELKDQNKPAESQAKTLQQALAYATFLGCLIRSESGKTWWKIFGKNLEKNNELPSPLHIDVVTVMPKPIEESNEGVLDDIPITEGELSGKQKDNKVSIILHPRTLYFEEKCGIPTIFFGTFKDSLVNKGE